MLDKIAHLAARYEAGKLRPPQPRRPRATPARRPNPEDRLTPLPRKFGWLAADLADAEPILAELAAELADPKLQPLIDAAPDRLGRLLRPICRALGLTPPGALRPTQSAQTTQAAPPPGNQAPPGATWPHPGYPIPGPLSLKTA